MRMIDITTLRKNLSKNLDQLEKDKVPILIRRKNHMHSVLVSFEDFIDSDLYDETAYLLSSPKNAQILEESIASIKNWEKTGLKKLVHDN